MRFMLLRKSDANTEAGRMPDAELLAAMACYRQAMVDAGVYVSGDALLSSASGARVTFSHGRTKVVDGPFAEAKELIAGFVVVDVESREQAIEWAARCPSLCEDAKVEIEIRRVVAAADLPAVDALRESPWSSVAHEIAARDRKDAAASA